MTKSKFLARVYLSILLNGTFQIALMDVLYYYILNAVPREFIYILLYPLPMAYALIGSFCVVVYVYCRPILKFIDAAGAGRQTETDLIFSVQKRLINLAYFIAGASFPAFIIGGVLAALIINYKMGWPLDYWRYGFYGGFFAGVLAIPTSIFAIDWSTYPLLKQTIGRLEGLDSAREAGFRISLRNKFIMNTLALVLAISGYCVVLGYSQADIFLKNMVKMEKLLPEDKASMLVDDIDGVADTRVRSSKYFETRMGSLKTFFVGLMAFGLILAAVMSVAVAGQITRPIKTLRNVTVKVKEGVYDDLVRMVSNDEFSDLAVAFNLMMSELKVRVDKSKSLLGSIHDAARTLTPITRDMVTISEQQSSSSIQQASAAEEAATSSYEIASAAQFIAENAGQVKGIAEQLLKITQDGMKDLDQTQLKFEDIERIVKEIVEALNSLAVQSGEISGIANIIRDISENTNLLSLNAALEAAGASVHGRRFAVVAKNVRRLASNSAGSTEKIHQLIGRIQSSLDSCILLATDGADAVDSGKNAILELTKRIGTIFNAGATASGHLKEIDTMTSQQAAASEQMAKTIAEVREAAKQGSTAADEIRQSMKNLEGLIENLNTHLESR